MVEIFLLVCVFYLAEQSSSEVLLYFLLGGINSICEPFMEQEMTSVENESIFRLMECTQDGRAMNIGFHKVEQMLDGSFPREISDLLFTVTQ